MRASNFDVYCQLRATEACSILVMSFDSDTLSVGPVVSTHNVLSCLMKDSLEGNWKGAGRGRSHSGMVATSMCSMRIKERCEQLEWRSESRFRYISLFEFIKAQVY